MKIWYWFAASAVWLGFVVVWTFDFHEGRISGFGLYIKTGRHLTPQMAFALASVLLYLILFGWIIPLCVGLWRLALRLTHRL